MIKINYELNEDKTIASYTIIPFDQTKSSIEIENINDILLNHSKVINDKLINDFDIKKYREEIQKPRQIDLSYPQLIQKLVAKKYSLADEIALLRQKEIKPDQYQEYYDYVEQCKQKAKRAISEIK